MSDPGPIGTGPGGLTRGQYAFVFGVIGGFIIALVFILL